MNDYISREEALHALCEAVHSDDGCVPCRNQLVSCRWTGTRTQEYAERILAIPPADVRPVVLCRDCKYSCDGIMGLSCSHGVCVDRMVTEDFFCAYGTPKEEENVSAD